MAAVLRGARAGFAGAFPSLTAPVLILGLALGAAAAEPAPRTDLAGDPIPAGAAVRLGTVRYRCSGSKNGLAFAVDDQTLVVGGDSREIVLIDAPTGKTIRRIGTGEQWVSVSLLTGDRKSVITLGHEFVEAVALNVQTLQRFDLESGELMKRIELGDRFGAEQVALTPFGNTIITANGIGTLGVWDVNTGEELLTEKIDQGRLDALAVSPDGQTIVGKGRQGLFFWEWLAGKEPAWVKTDRRIASLAFSPDGQTIAEGLDNRAEIVFRDLNSREVLRTFADPTGTPMYVTGLAFTGDGRRLAVANAIGRRDVKSRIYIVDVATGKAVQEFETGSVKPYKLALSSDGRWLAAGGWDSLIQVWDLTTGRLVTAEAVGHDNPISSIHLARDATTALTASDDGTLRIWDASTGRQVRLLDHGYWVRATALSPDGRWIASSSLDDTVRLWETATGREVYRLAGHGELGGKRAVAFTPDGRRLASWGDDWYLRVWDVQTGKALVERRVDPGAAPNEKVEDEADRRFDFGLRREIDGVALSPDARRLAIGYQQQTFVYDVETGSEVAKFEHEDGSIMSMVFSPDGEKLATSSWGKPIETPLANGGSRFSSEKNNMARVRQTATGEELFRVPQPDSGAGPVVFSADGRLLALASQSDGATIRLFDAATGNAIAQIEGVPRRAQDLAFSPDGRRLACSFWDGTALIWDVEEVRKAD